MVLDRVLDPVTAPLDDARLALGLGRVEHADLRGVVAARAEHDQSAVLGGPDAEEELLVLLFPHARVPLGRCPELVAPDLVGAHRLVRPGVEEHPAVSREREAVGGVLDRVVEIDARSRGRGS